MPLLGSKKTGRVTRARGRSQRTGLFARKPAPKPRPSVVWAALAAAVILVAAISFQETLPRRTSVNEPKAPVDFSALLPAGAELSPQPPMEVPDVPQPSYVVGYVLHDTPFAAYLRWNKSRSGYELAADVPLAAGQARLFGQPTFTVENVGPLAPLMVVARASEGASTGGAFFLMQKDNTLLIATKQEADGTLGPAHFLEGASATHSDAFTLQDVDSDGNRDVVTTVSVLAEKGSMDKIVSVYAWREGRFAYDADLSATLTLSAKVFPEPTAEPATQP